MQIYLINHILAFVVSLLLWQYHYICIKYGSGPADVFPEAEADEHQEVKLDSFLKDTRSVHKKPANAENPRGEVREEVIKRIVSSSFSSYQPQKEAGQVLCLKGGVYWDSPSTALM